jgi:hypothetical protein
MSALEDKAVELITQLQHLAPKATALALQSIRVDAVQNMIYDGVASVAGLILLLNRRRIGAVFKSRMDEDDIPSFIGLGLVWAIIALVSVIGVVDLLSPWTYIQFTHPEVYMAHQLIHSTGAK